jgi:hydroxymethylpyrimidine/phosphomethylpyrimidine kinase
MRTALTIAGSDSGGGAGIQADLKTFAAHGVFGTSAITAVTAQNTFGVSAWQALPADLVTAQIEAVAGDIGADAVKTGMLANAAIVEAVAAAIASLDLPLVVVDPVMVAKGGDRLLEEDAIAALRSELLPRAHVVTPNIPEAEVIAEMPIRSTDDMRTAGDRILAMGPRVVVVKGGHLDSPDVVDIVCTREGGYELRGPRIPGRATHGTGCTLASAIAANLALGSGDREAIERARAYLEGAIRHAPRIGHGHGPLDHFWRAVYSKDGA